MNSLEDTIDNIPEWLQYVGFIFLIFGVPIAIGLSLEVFQETDWYIWIVVILWWLLIAGWVKFYEERKSFRRFAIKITRINPEDLKKHISEAAINVDGWDWKNYQIPDEESVKVKELIGKINKEYDWKDV